MHKKYNSRPLLPIEFAKCGIVGGFVNNNNISYVILKILEELGDFIFHDDRLKKRNVRS